MGHRLCCQIWLVENLQAKLNDARLKGAVDLAAVGVGSSPGDGGQRRCAADAKGLRRGSLCAADSAGQIEVGVVEDVIELRAELYLQALDRRVELLVEGEIRLIEGR